MTTNSPHDPDGEAVMKARGILALVLRSDRLPLILQAARFGVVGLAATLVHVTVFTAFIEGLGAWPAAANIAGFLVAFSVSFAGHDRWTFAEKDGEAQSPVARRQRLQRFLIVSLVGLALNALIVEVVTGVLRASYGYAVIFMLTVVPGAMFLLNRAWAFSPSPSAGLEQARPDETPVLGREGRGRAYLALGLLSLAGMLPALLLREILRGHDGHLHMRWLVYFGRQFWSGEIFPRWLPDLNSGFGSPAFFIYPPLPYMITALLEPFAPAPELAPMRLGFAGLIALCGGGIAVRAWLLRSGLDGRSALLGALVYVAAPYHLFIDTYYRGAFAELWAFTWAPVALLGVLLMRTASARGLLLFTLALAATILSHAPSALVLPPLCCLYAFFIFLQDRKWVPLAMAAGGAILAVLLAGGYLATALTHNAYIHADALFTGRYNSSNWLLLSKTLWPDEATRKAITVVALLQGGFAVVAFAIAARLSRSGRDTAALFFWAGVTAVSFLMMTAVAAPFWNLNTPLNKLQFPWRLLIIQTLALPPIVAFAMSALNGWSDRRSTLLKIALWLGLWSLVASDVGLHVYTAWKDRKDGDLVISVEKVLADSRDAPEYQLGDISSLKRRFLPDQKVVVVAGKGEANVLSWRPRQIALESQSTTPITILVRQFNYSGWRVCLDGTELPSNFTPRDVGQPVSLTVPGGRHQISLDLVPTRAEVVGHWMSMAGAVLLSVWIVVILTVGAKRRRAELDAS